MALEHIEVEAAPAPEGGELSTIRKIAARQIAAKEDVERLVTELKAAEAKLKSIAEQELPTAMLGLGIRDFTLDTGHKIAVITSHHAGLTEAKKPEAFSWLQQEGLDDLIKRELVIQFGRGEGSLADACAAVIREMAPQNKFNDKNSIHASTLGAFVRERIANGEPLPLEVFGVYTRTVAEITEPNKKKETLRKNMASTEF